MGCSGGGAGSCFSTTGGGSGLGCGLTCDTGGGNGFGAGLTTGGGGGVSIFGAGGGSGGWTSSTVSGAGTLGSGTRRLGSSTIANACSSSDTPSATLTDGSRYQLVGGFSAAQGSSKVDIG